MINSVEKSLQGEPFSIDPIACSQAAKVLSLYKAPSEELPWSAFPEAVQLTFKIAFVSVCHSFNWDFLQGRMAEELLVSAEKMASRLSTLSSREFAGWLVEYPKQERVRAQERSKILRNVGQVLLEEWGGDAGGILAQCQGKLVGENGFLDLLDRFDAYSVDPLRKKSQVLAHDLLREGTIDFVDKEKIAPAIDYHIMRSYLRTGRVVPRSPALNPYLGGHPNPRARLVNKLREAVAEAAELTAFYAGISVPDLNYVEWQFGRSICTAEQPSCDHVPKERLPHDVVSLVETKCPYSIFCAARLNENYQMYQEPVFDKGYY